MKVIGRTAESGYLLEATGGEVANLLGYHSKYDDNFPKKIVVINIAGMFKQLYALASIEGKIARAKKELLEIAGSLEFSMPFNVEVKPDEKEK